MGGEWTMISRKGMTNETCDISVQELQRRGMFKLVDAQGYLPSSFFLRNVGEHASPFIDSGPSNQYAILSWKQVTLPLGHSTKNSKKEKKKRAHQNVSKAEHGNIKYNEANRIWAQISSLSYYVRRHCKGKIRSHLSTERVWRGQGDSLAA